MGAGSFSKKLELVYAEKFPTFEEGKELALNNESVKYVCFGNKLSGDAPCVSFHILKKATACYIFLFVFLWLVSCFFN